MNILAFIRNWILPIAMLSGVAAYFIYTGCTPLHEYHLYITETVSIIQPFLIFLMLFLTFCKIDIRDLHIRRWHIWLLLVQIILFAAIACFTIWHPRTDARVLLEAAMLCFICPTATAVAVVVRKLGGSAADVTTYTILINLVTAAIVPIFIPLVHPHPELAFSESFLLIIAKVFPLLLCPLLCAVLVRHFLPRFHGLLTSWADLPFYLWAIALALAICVTTRSIVHSDVSPTYQIGIAFVSLASCLLQFYVGKRIGRHYGDSITAGQALGQKNTVLAIWMGYTFFTPVTAIAGGFYSVWHNLINSWQLYRKRRQVGNQ